MSNFKSVGTAFLGLLLSITTTSAWATEGACQQGKTAPDLGILELKETDTRSGTIRGRVLRESGLVFRDFLLTRDATGEGFESVGEAIGHLLFSALTMGFTNTDYRKPVDGREVCDRSSNCAVEFEIKTKDLRDGKYRVEVYWDGYFGGNWTEAYHYFDVSHSDPKASLEIDLGTLRIVDNPDLNSNLLVPADEAVRP